MNYALVRNTIPALCIVATALAQQPAATPPPPPTPDSNSDAPRNPPPPPREDRRPGDERRRPGDRFGDRMGDRLDAAARDPQQLKEMIDRMLEQNGRIERRLTDAKSKLEAGTPPEEVIRMLREARSGSMAEQFFQTWRERQGGDLSSQGPMFEKPPGGGPDPEQREELLQFIREVRPEFGSRLEQWQKAEPKAFRAVVGHLMMQAIDTFRERDRDKQLYDLRREDLRASIFIVEKATEVRGMQAAGKGQPESEDFIKMKAELRDLMGKGYDARVKVREYEADKLAKRLEETRAKIQETKDVREQMLDKAVMQLLERKRVTPQPGDGPPRPPGEPGGRRPEPASGPGPR